MNGKQKDITTIPLAQHGSGATGDFICTSTNKVKNICVPVICIKLVVG